MAILHVAQVHQGLTLRLINPTTCTICLLKRRLCLGVNRGQRLQSGWRDPGNELGITETFVVTAIAKELSCIFEEESEVLGANVGLLSEAVPVAIASTVERNDQIVDRLRFRRYLAQCDSSAFKSGSEITTMSC